MILPLWRSRPDQFVNFHHQEARIATLEAALLKQQAINEDLLTYVEARMDAPWANSGKTLAAAIREALKE